MNNISEAPRRRGPEDYDPNAPSDGLIVTFEAEETATTLKRLHHFLHQYPTAVPFVVLLVGIASSRCSSADGFSRHSTFH